MSEEMAKSFVLWSWLCPALRSAAQPLSHSQPREFSATSDDFPAQLGLHSTHGHVYFFSRTGDSLLEGALLIVFRTSLLFSKCFCLYSSFSSTSGRSAASEAWS
jgi:hypothetical protein